MNAQTEPLSGAQVSPQPEARTVVLDTLNLFVYTHHNFVCPIIERLESAVQTSSVFLEILKEEYKRITAEEIEKDNPEGAKAIAKDFLSLIDELITLLRKDLKLISDTTNEQKDQKITS